MKSLRSQIDESKHLPSQFRALSEDIGIHTRALRNHEDSEEKAIYDHKIQIQRTIEGFNTAIDEQSVSGCSAILSQIGGVFLSRRHIRNVPAGSATSSTSTLAHEHHCSGKEPERCPNYRLSAKRDKHFTSILPTHALTLVDRKN